MIDEDDDGGMMCKQCRRSVADEDGFCSDYCMKRYDFELSQVEEYDGDFDTRFMDDDCD